MSGFESHIPLPEENDSPKLEENLPDSPEEHQESLLPRNIEEVLSDDFNWDFEK